MRATGPILGAILAGLTLAVPAWAGSGSDPLLGTDALFDLPDEYAVLAVAPTHRHSEPEEVVHVELFPDDDLDLSDSDFTDTSKGSGRHRYKKRDLFRAEKRFDVGGDYPLRLRLRIKAKRRELMSVELKF